jgi:hypothetical protein
MRRCEKATLGAGLRSDLPAADAHSRTPVTVKQNLLLIQQEPCSLVSLQSLQF